MKALVISKPIYEYIIPLVDFPQDGDKFFINESIKTVSSIGTIVSVLLASYGIDTSFTGMIGEDDYGHKIKEFFDTRKVENSYIETSYEEHTCSDYKIYNTKSNKFTTIMENSLKKNLTKYKYEFIPDTVIMDDGDYSANMAAINNYPNANLIYISEKYTKESSAYLSKCKYVIATLDFASVATGVVNGLNKPKNIVTLFQKYIDLYQSNLIIRLNNFDFLYCVNDEVRLIKNVNKNLNNKEYVYYAVLVYFLINTNNIEESIKYTNKAMMNSASELNMIDNIPEYKIVNELLTELNKRLEESVNQTTKTEALENNDTNKVTNETNNNVNTLNENSNQNINSEVTTSNTNVQSNNANNISSTKTVTNTTTNVANEQNSNQITPVEVTKIDNNNVGNTEVLNTNNIEMPNLDNKKEGEQIIEKL